MAMPIRLPLLPEPLYSLWIDPTYSAHHVHAHTCIAPVCWLGKARMEEVARGTRNAKLGFIELLLPTFIGNVPKTCNKTM